MMYRRLHRALIITLTVAASGPALAEISTLGFHITAQSNGDTASAEWSTDDMQWNEPSQTWQWTLTDARPLAAPDGRVLATLTVASARIDVDPSIALNFSVQAGDADTQITIESGPLSIELRDPWARASIALALTDTNDDGALLRAPDTGRVFATFIDGYAFTDLVHDDLVASPGQSVSIADAYPPVDYQHLDQYGASEMDDTTEFRLSAHDLASGTSQFEVIPEPSAILLWLPVALLLPLRRRYFPTFSPAHAP